ncbi:MAG: hypothetical protein P8J33_09790, partial [Pirellulaceae bacterium]|nr:hypothetical protein [Pirellulaceae bacterium]
MNHTQARHCQQLKQTDSRYPTPETDPPRTTEVMEKIEQIQVIAFDADDTLWVNETFFREAESLFCDLLSGYLPADEAFQILYETEMKNLPLYGYGIKPFTLSLIEAAVRISQGK